MPNCFQLLRDGVAVVLVDVDEEMCRHFGVQCHEHWWYEGWYDLIGYDLAKGDSFDEIRRRYADQLVLVQIADWLEANFTVRRWYETKSRPKLDGIAGS